MSKSDKETLHRPQVSTPTDTNNIIIITKNFAIITMSGEQSTSNKGLSSEEQTPQKIDSIKLTASDITKQLAEIQLNYLKIQYKNEHEIDRLTKEVADQLKETEEWKQKYLNLIEEHRRLEYTLELVHDYSKKKTEDQIEESWD